MESLTFIERKILNYISSFEDGDLITWDDLAKEIYNGNDDLSYRGALRTHINRLRRKLGVQLLTSVSKVGYYKGKVSVCEHCGGAGVIVDGN